MITITAKIYISETEIVEINRNNLLSVEISIFDRSDLKLPSFGVISNVGNLSFNDNDMRFLQYANEGVDLQGTKVDIFLNNTLVDGATETIGTFYTDNWEYDNDNKVVSISLKDDLEEWQDINVPEISYDPRNPTEQPFSKLYTHLWDITQKSYKMLSLDELDETTKSVLELSYIRYYLLESGSLWQQWTKLCQTCQLHIYKEEDGVIVCRYNGGN